MDRVDGCLWGCVRFRCQLLNWQDGSDSIWKNAMGPLSYFFLFPFGARRKNRIRKRSRKKGERKRKRGRSAETFFFWWSERREETEKRRRKDDLFRPPASGCSPLYRSVVRSFVRVLYRSDYETTGHGRNSNADAIILHL
jgi:hypothetical protein